MHHLVYFFCFRHHHTYTIFSLRYYVVVILALRVPSNSVSLLHSFAPCLHTSFPICLLKSSCNSYPTSTCFMTNTLRVLESRVLLHYLIKIVKISKSALPPALIFFSMKISFNFDIEFLIFSFTNVFLCCSKSSLDRI